MTTLDDLMRMRGGELLDVMRAGHPLDLQAMADTQYLGVDLSLPRVGQRLLWQTFRKTFHRDPAVDGLRGWNVRMEQHGVDGPAIPLRDRRGEALTFGHYRVRSAAGESFPHGWKGAHFLDYGSAGNTFFDAARVGYTPLVAVNAGSAELLLGWEVVRIAGVKLPLPLYWALRLQGPLEQVVAVPR